MPRVVVVVGIPQRRIRRVYVSSPSVLSTYREAFYRSFQFAPRERQTPHIDHESQYPHHNSSIVNSNSYGPCISPSVAVASFSIRSSSSPVARIASCSHWVSMMGTVVVLDCRFINEVV